MKAPICLDTPSCGNISQHPLPVSIHTRIASGRMGPVALFDGVIYFVFVSDESMGDKTEITFEIRKVICGNFPYSSNEGFVLSECTLWLSHTKWQSMRLVVLALIQPGLNLRIIITALPTTQHTHGRIKVRFWTHNKHSISCHHADELLPVWCSISEIIDQVMMGPNRIHVIYPYHSRLFTGNGTILRLRECHWSNPEG